jgi:hypothetical protein
MKKLLIFTLGMLAAADLWAASLQETYARRSAPVAVAVLEPVNHSQDEAFSTADFKKALEEKLAARRTPRFAVGDPSAAEITLETEVTESMFTEHDPVDKLSGIGGTAYDAATVEHYARLTAVFTVKDAKSGRVLWTDKLKGTVTDKTMSRDESRPKVAARAAEIFIREAFGKKRK